MEAESKGRKKNGGSRNATIRVPLSSSSSSSVDACLFGARWKPVGRRGAFVHACMCVGEARGGDVRAYARGGGRRALPEEMKRGRRATTTRFECRYSVRENSQ